MNRRSTVRPTRFQRLLLSELDQVGHISKRQGRDSIGRAVIDRQAAGGLVTEHGAREHDIGHVAYALVGRLAATVHRAPSGR